MERVPHSINKKDIPLIKQMEQVRHSLLRRALIIATPAISHISNTRFFISRGHRSEHQQNEGARLQQSAPLCKPDLLLHCIAGRTRVAAPTCGFEDNVVVIPACQNGSMMAYISSRADAHAAHCTSAMCVGHAQEAVMFAVTN